MALAVVVKAVQELEAIEIGQAIVQQHAVRGLLLAQRQGPVAAPLVFEVEGLQAEARAAQAELATAGLRHVQLAVGPFGVRLKGARDDAEKRRALRTIWPAILGPLRVEP